MNPPYGTKEHPHLDRLFVEKGCSISDGEVYSMQKSSTRDFWGKWAESIGRHF